MDGGNKVDGVNGATPLPQRAQKNMPQGNKKPNLNAPQQKQNDLNEGAPAEKKPRFNQNGQNQGGNQNKGFGGNQNRGGFNRNQQQNRNQQNQSRGNQNQNQQNQNQNKPNQQNQRNNQPDVVKPAVDANQADKKEVVAPAQQQPTQQQPQQKEPQQQQQQQQNQQRNQPQNQQQQQPQNQNQNNNQNQNQHQNQNQNQHQNQNQNQNQNQHQNRNRGGQGGYQGGGGGGGGMQGIHGGNQGGFGGNQGGHGGNQGGHNRDRSRGGRGGQGGQGGNIQGNNPYNRSDEYFIGQRVRAIGGPTHELPPVEATEEPKFSGRNRLYVGNLTNDINENELREMFKPFGEIGEIFCNAEKNFTFLKLDFHANAQRAKRELDGTNRKGRQLRVRFAPNATILRVKNLTPFVSNELLYRSFEIFGPIERANVVVDDRGKSTGEGVVEFAKKSSANVCLRFCTEKCFFLTASLRPCVVEPFEVNEDDDGLPDKSLNKKSPEFHHERGVGPRFAELGSFEHEYGTRWKQLHELFRTKQEAMKRELKMEEEKLEAQMEYARYEHETDLLRQELRKRESDNERKKMEWEMREKQAEEMRKRDEENMRRQQTEMQGRMMRQEEEMRRRQQENTLFMQAQQLNSLLDQQEGFGGNAKGGNAVGNVGGGGGGGNSTGNGPNNPQDAFSFEFGGGNQNQGGGGNQRGGNNNGNNNPWERRRRF